MAFRGARRLRRAARALAACVWQCLVAAGAVQLAGETARADAGRLLHEPAPGHPERLRPDVPLTALERSLLRDLGLVD
ncbi:MULTISPECIES: DUF6059 family protein [unclassified Streptomyces]|jgi:hypothetical protein|uniref:DUF6059 family protein n=1 Tax=unclassified Streptomyces TaxID=2593676 RepID=UPI00114DC18C|nr:DUF6059 family protein [Streptomyces sp. SLBN-31]TQJ92824.1 hypothetical protein FBY22_3761 [Streptomyces sp. SLBN-31]